MKILHLGGNEIFLPPLINFIKENFNFEEHEFLLTSGMGGVLKFNNVKIFERKIIARLIYYISAWIGIQKSNKIILHGIFDIKLLFVLVISPWSLKKCCWVIWGGDLYEYSFSRKEWFGRVRELIRRYIIRRLGIITTMVPGDYVLAQKWYKARAIYISNLMYLSHIARDVNAAKCQLDKGTQLYIQIGKSSDPGNNHEELLIYLSRFTNRNFKIYCPLSYGQEEYKHQIIKLGKKIFGEDFIPITEMMGFEEYNNYMACIDVTIFNHDRQQAMGNIIGLLSLGKKVALKKTTTPYSFFEALGVRIYTMQDGLTMPIDEEVSGANKKLMMKYFSKETLKNNWSSVFNEK